MDDLYIYIMGQKERRKHLVVGNKRNTCKEEEEMRKKHLNREEGANRRAFVLQQQIL